MKRLRQCIELNKRELKVGNELKLTEDQEYMLHGKIQRLQRYKKLKETYCDRASQRYEEERHSTMLEHLWDTLKRGEKSSGAKPWCELGFRSEDPVEDLGRTGFLGLKQLHTFVV